MITLNQWQHVCVTFDSTTVRVYLNGVLKGTRTYTQGPVTTTVTYKIGRSNANNLFFHGDIKDAKIYSRTVTDLEVLTIQSVRSTGAGHRAHQSHGGWQRGLRQSVLAGPE